MCRRFILDAQAKYQIGSTNLGGKIKPEAFQELILNKREFVPFSFPSLGRK
jgi:hypothetical protein